MIMNVFQPWCRNATSEPDVATQPAESPPLIVKPIDEEPISDGSEHLDRISQASVKLASLVPRVATLAADMETQAQTQARRASTIADTMDLLTKDLEKAVAELRTSSGQVESAIATVARIAEHTRILSLNATIEAARAGEHGRAFSVVVDEVKRLADRTGETTHLIEARVQEMHSSILQVATVTGDHAAASSAETRTVEAVNQEVHGMARSAEQQLGGVKTLHALGDEVNTLTETLLLAVGTFRFAAHARAEREVAPLVDRLLATSNERIQLEGQLTRWLEQHPHFEVVYLTDPRGRQIVDNLVWRQGRVSRDSSGFNRDWSQRPWYRDAIRHLGVWSTDIYRSTATGDFCFTIAAALRDRTGAIRGVLGADVNFQRLVQR
jgi:hypothetical protein